MHGQTRTNRRFAFVGIAAALAMPAVAGGGTTDPTLRNDAAHFGASSAGDHSSATLRNDNAHFGAVEAPSKATSPASSAPIVLQVDEGFDWVSAAVGAAGAVGFVLVAGAGASALRRRGGSTVHP